MAPKLKLVYFNIRGRGELIRLTLHAGGVDFVDERIEFADWPARREHAPNGKLPYIEVDGKQYGEALPIVRFLAKKCSLMGSSEGEQLLVDTVLCQVNSIRDDMARIKMDPILNKGQKKYLENKLASETVPDFLTRTENGLTQSKSGYLLGSKMTVADLAVWDAIDVLLTDRPDLIQSYPKIQEHRRRIPALPKLTKYINNRPQTKI